MLLFSLLTFSFAYGNNVDSAGEEAPRDTAPQAPDRSEEDSASGTPLPPTKLPVVVSPPQARGQWDEVITLLQHQVQSGTRPLGPVCRAAQGDTHWVEMLTPTGEWRAVSKPRETITASVSQEPALASIKELNPQNIVACTVVKPWVEGMCKATAASRSVPLPTASALLVSIPVSIGQ